jgi:hypothetical protein
MEGRPAAPRSAKQNNDGTCLNSLDHLWRPRAALAGGRCPYSAASSAPPFSAALMSSGRGIEMML